MFHSVNICSMLERPFLKRAWFSRRIASMAFWIWFRSILVKTSPGVDVNVIPRQLLQSLRLPFFGSLITTPCVQSSGTSVKVYISILASVLFTPSTLDKSPLYLANPVQGTAVNQHWSELRSGDYTEYRLLRRDYTEYRLLRRHSASGERAFSFSGPLTWNTLPPVFHDITNQKQFGKC